MGQSTRDMDVPSRRRKRNEVPGDPEMATPVVEDIPVVQRKKDEPLPPNPPYLWTSAPYDHASKELRFPGFEPCYIACIKNVEWQIKRKVQTIDLNTDNEGLADEMAPLLLRYSELLKALESIETKDRVFEEDALRNPDDFMTRYEGQKRRISRTSTDSDAVHEHLRNNLLLVVLGYIYTWDAADKLKRQFGNLTTTLDRVIVGIAGGAALLVPMIMMVFLPTRTARLIIVSIATMLFALLVSLLSVTKDSVLASTAAYAAIMVVFIGSSDTVNGGSS